MEQDLQNAFNAFNDGRGANDGAVTPKATNQNDENVGAQGTESQNNNAEQNSNNSGNGQSDQSQQNSQFARMRIENSNMRQTIKQFEAVAKAAGYDSVEAYLEAANKPQQPQQPAQSQKDPEVQKLEDRIKQLEQQAKQSQQQSATEKLNREVNQLVGKYKISQDDWYAFIDNLNERGIHYGNDGTLEGLYLQFNFDKIVQSKVDEAKQTWLQNQNTAKQNAPTPTPTGIPSPDKSNTNAKKVDFRGMALDKFKK